MKKILTITLTCLCLLSLAACTNKNNENIEILEPQSQPAEVPALEQTRGDNNRGCCSFHNGVKACSQDGTLLCNDGTKSSCKCKN